MRTFVSVVELHFHVPFVGSSIAGPTVPISILSRARLPVARALAIKTLLATLQVGTFCSLTVVSSEV